MMVLWVSAARETLERVKAPKVGFVPHVVAGAPGHPEGHPAVAPELGVVAVDAVEGQIVKRATEELLAVGQVVQEEIGVCELKLAGQRLIFGEQVPGGEEVALCRSDRV